MHALLGWGEGVRLAPGCADLPKRIKQKAIPVPAAALAALPEPAHGWASESGRGRAHGGPGGRGGPGAAAGGAPRGRRYSAATGRGRAGGLSQS